MTNMERVRAAIGQGHTTRPAMVQASGLTHAQVQSALQNLVQAGRAVLVEQRQAGQYRGRAPGVYGLADNPPAQKRARVRRDRPAPKPDTGLRSVWDLGQRDRA